jgi:hypothetical protein
MFHCFPNYLREENPNYLRGENPNYLREENPNFNNNYIMVNNNET